MVLSAQQKSLIKARAYLTVIAFCWLYFIKEIENDPLLVYMMQTLQKVCENVHPCLRQTLSRVCIQSHAQNPRYPCPVVERATKTSGGKRSAMTCAASPQRSLLPVPPLYKGNEDSGNENDLRHFLLNHACGKFKRQNG